MGVQSEFLVCTLKVGILHNFNCHGGIKNNSLKYRLLLLFIYLIARRVNGSGKLVLNISPCRECTDPYLKIPFRKSQLIKFNI
jgi:hypothetical protein